MTVERSKVKAQLESDSVGGGAGTRGEWGRNGADVYNVSVSTDESSDNVSQVFKKKKKNDSWACAIVKNCSDSGPSSFSDA